MSLGPDSEGVRWFKVLEKLRDTRDLIPHEGVLPMTAASLPLIVAVDDELDFLRVAIRYLLLDVEATHRELKAAQDALHKQED